uniref:uncharacterized protein LOC120338067 n=1 Tax=Styela clava TaxID=7725 RepID=UPI00193A0449|nr:uncharacterized protein LOC120338067 [Styela clava]
MDYSAAVSGQNELQGNRPRSVAAEVSRDIDINTFIEILTNSVTTKDYMQELTALYETRPKLWVLSFRQIDENNIDKSKRDEFLKNNTNILRVGDVNIQFLPPKKPPTRISIKDVPDEIKQQQVIDALIKTNCGKIKNIIKLYHRGTTLFNGYVAAWLYDFDQTKFPPFLDIDGARYKTYLPTELYTPKCINCLESGHTARSCRKMKRCRVCGKEGHISFNCPEKKNDPQHSIRSWLKTNTTNRPQTNKNKRQIKAKVSPSKTPTVASPKKNVTPSVEYTETNSRSSSETELIDLESKETKDWSLSPDISEQSFRLSPPPPAIPRRPKLKTTSTIGNTPFHPPKIGGHFPLVIPELDSATSYDPVFSDTPQTSSAPACLGSQIPERKNTKDQDPQTNHSTSQVNKRDRSLTDSSPSYTSLKQPSAKKGK